MTDASEQKEAIRNEMRERLRELDQAETVARSTEVCRRVAAWEGFGRAGVVMLYLPIGGEVDVAGLALRAFQDGKSVCVPRMDWKFRRMTAVEIRGFDDEFEQRQHGVREPVSGRAIPIEEIDLVIVPGLAFDPSCRRLGRGGGFYDRFLAHPALGAHGASLCGVCFDFQVIDEAPAEEHDVPLTAVATDRRLITASCRRRA